MEIDAPVSQVPKSAFKLNSARSSKEQSALLEEANRKWLELDKGMRSNDYGILVYTMSTFPEFFMDYRLPAYINSGFMKLASTFRTSNNHLRWHIANVFLDSKNHWSMVQNVSDICRMLVSIMYSNDQIARALTLVVIGTIADASADAIPLQRVLIESLDRYLDRSDGKVSVRRHDMHERNAAIKSCVKFCRSSSSFSDKVLEVMRARLRQHFSEESEYPRLLSYMKLNARKALEVYSLFEELIRRETSDRFKMLCIHCLGVCADRNCLIVPSMMRLYSNRMQNQLSTDCIQLYLKTLERIIRNNPVLCNEELIMDFIGLASTSQDSIIATTSLHLVGTCLEKSLCDLDLQPSFFQTLESLLFCTCTELAIESCRIALLIVRYETSLSDEPTSECCYWQTVHTALLGLLEKFITSSEFWNDSAKSLASLTIEACLWKKADSDKLAFKLCQWSAFLTDEAQLSTILTSIGRTLDKNLPNISGPEPSGLIAGLISCIKRSFPNGMLKTKATLCLFTEAVAGFDIVEPDLLNQVITSISLTDLYFFARKAMRLGLFGCAKESLKLFQNLNLSFKYNVWMTSILHACTAEFELEKLSRISEKDDCCAMYIQKAEEYFTFCERRLSLFNSDDVTFWRIKYFESRSFLASLCFGLCSIISDCLLLGRDLRFFDSQLCCGDLFSLLDLARTNVCALLNSMFDADQESVDTVRRQLEIFEVIDYIFNCYIPNCPSEDHCSISKEYQELLPPDIDHFEKRLTATLNCLYMKLLRPMPIPRFIFQRLQTTHLQVNFSPELASYQRPVQIKSHEDFSILVEGFMSYTHCPASANVPQLNTVQKVCIKVHVIKLPSNLTTDAARDALKSQHSQPLFEVSARVNNEAYFATNILINKFTDGESSCDNKAAAVRFEPPAAKMPKSGTRENWSVYAVVMLIDYEDQNWQRWSNLAEHVTYVMKVGRNTRKQ